MNLALLSVRGLVKRFTDATGGPLLAIDAFDVPRGACIVLTGDNGAGKSTLLRALAGLEPASAERFEFDGRLIAIGAYPAELRRAILYVHQHPYMFSGSLERNLGYGLAVRALATDERRRRVEAAIDWAGLDSVRDAPAPRLSGGEKQRVALARAWVLEPRLFLLDEPTANLDASARVQVIALIRRLQTEGRSVVVACHDQELVELPDASQFHLAAGRLERVR